MDPNDIAKIVKNLVQSGVDDVDIAKIVKGLFTGSDDAVKPVSKIVDDAPSAPKLVSANEGLPKTKVLKTKKVKPEYDSIAFENYKYSDFIDADDFSGMDAAQVKTAYNRFVHAKNTEKLTEAGRAARAAEKAENKAAHAATRTPEARAEALRKQREYKEMIKKKNEGR